MRTVDMEYVRVCRIILIGVVVTTTRERDKRRSIAVILPSHEATNGWAPALKMTIILKIHQRIAMAAYHWPLRSAQVQSSKVAAKAQWLETRAAK